MVVNGFDESRDRNVLTAHDAVSDAAVVGLQDQEWGETIHAVVVLHQGAIADSEDLRAFCRECVRSSKTPDTIRVWDELPYTPTGKLPRRPSPWQRGSFR